MIPAIYAFLPNKKQSTYERLFRSIVEHCRMFNLVLQPESASVDFELSIINALITVWPTVIIKGCLFHQYQTQDKKYLEINKKLDVLWSRFFIMI